MKYFISFLFSIIIGHVGAQIEPVTWTMESIIGEDESVILSITADIDPTWKIYSRQTEEGGPIPMEIFFETDVTLDGMYIEVEEPKTYESEMFMMNVSTFSDKAVFHQAISDYSPGSKVNAIVTFMTCNGKQCLPPTEVELEVIL